MSDQLTPAARLAHRHAHDPSICEGENCCIHNPSDHHMRGFKQNYRLDRGLMERICPHGVGHPDPDHLDFVERVRGKEAARVEAVHGCDGCCKPPADPIHLPKLISERLCSPRASREAGV